MRISTTLILCLLYLNVFGQTDSTAYQKFYSGFLDSYKLISKPPLGNYFEILNKVTEYRFSTDNDQFMPALSEIMKQERASEKEAVESLFNKVFVDIKKDLWINFLEIYESKAKLFDIFTTSQCPCYTSKVKKTDMMEKMMTAVKECLGNIISDTAFVNGMKREGGENTINELFKLQMYSSLYIYAKCDIVNYKMNESIKNISAFAGYFDAINERKKQEGKNLVRLFMEKKLDSLAMIFPDHKKFTAELNKIAAMAKQSGGIAHSRFYGNVADGKPKLIMSYYSKKKDKESYSLTMHTSANELNSVFTSISLENIKPLRPGKEEVIIEIEEKPKN